jgi:replication-associated recombination protein RarA
MLPFPEPLVEKYRPRTIDGFIGLVRAKRIFQPFIDKPFDSSWVLVGPSGLGKTAWGMALADDIHAELHHVPSQQCDLAKVQEITQACRLAAFDWKSNKAKMRHLVLVDEAEDMTIGSQRTLLSKLDAAASIPNTVWVFTANSKKAFEDRFLSRCREVPFDTDAVEGELAHFLRTVYRAEGGSYPLDFIQIAKEASFNIRTALMKLEVELLIGANRKGLPPEKAKQLAEHVHQCKSCDRPWKCHDANCELPFRHDCQGCGGAKTVGSLRAFKAHDTMRKKREEREKEIARQARKKGKKRA